MIVPEQVRLAVVKIGRMSEDDVRDYEQGLCMFCQHGYDVVPGPRGGTKGDRPREPAHDMACPYATIKWWVDSQMPEQTS